VSRPTILDDGNHRHHHRGCRVHQGALRHAARQQDDAEIDEQHVERLRERRVDGGQSGYGNRDTLHSLRARLEASECVGCAAAAGTLNEVVAR
tara:strand:- start:366 stop:644 length:279 start_codon:yes stop_codon:yes gene_type:complete